MSQHLLSRRLFLSHAALSSAAIVVPGASALVLGCSSARGEVRVGDASAPSVGAASATARARAPRCAPGVATDANIEGPYYRPGAPFRADLVEPGMAGLPLLLSGAVMSLDCKTPLAAYAIAVNEKLWLRAFVAEPDGTKFRRDEVTVAWPKTEPEAEAIGLELGRALRTPSGTSKRHTK